jgi:hypothetical protein
LLLWGLLTAPIAIWKMARAAERRLGGRRRPITTYPQPPCGPLALGQPPGKSPPERLSAQPPRMGTHLRIKPPPATGGQPERHRKIPELREAEDRSILYGTVFGWKAGLLRLRQGRAWNRQKPTVIETAFDPQRSFARHFAIYEPLISWVIIRGEILDLCNMISTVHVLLEPRWRIPV